jgi:hypothetical protein
MSERIDIMYRRHRIIAGQWQGTSAAMVYDGTAKLHQADGSTVAAAMEKAKTWIDDLLDGQIAGRRLPRVGTREEYVRAFRTLSLGKCHEDMLRAHANAPKHTLTATELARTAGYDSYEVANFQYGKLGRQVAEFLNLPLRIDPRRGEPVWTTAIAAGADEGEDENGHWQWTMHPEVVQALRDLNMA